MIELVSGDMFEYEAAIRVNTVNCVGIMGKGVALAFRKKQPEMFQEYVIECKEGRLQPGILHIWKDHVSNETTINFPTKRHWRNKSSYHDVELGLKTLREYLLKAPLTKVTLPALGCGHGGLDWNLVLPMIQQYLGDLEHIILVFQPGDSRKVVKNMLDHQAKKKVSELDDVLLITSRNFSAIEEQAIKSFLERWFDSGKSVGLSVSSPYTSTALGVASSRISQLRLWGTSESKRSFSLPEDRVSLVAGNALQAALDHTRAVLITDPNPNWLTSASSKINVAHFRVNYPSGTVISLGDYSSRMLST